MEQNLFVDNFAEEVLFCPTSTPQCLSLTTTKKVILALPPKLKICLIEVCTYALFIQNYEEILQSGIERKAMINSHDEIKNVFFD